MQGEVIALSWKSMKSSKYKVNELRNLLVTANGKRIQRLTLAPIRLHCKKVFCYLIWLSATSLIMSPLDSPHSTM